MAKTFAEGQQPDPQQSLAPGVDPQAVAAAIQQAQTPPVDQNQELMNTLLRGSQMGTEAFQEQLQRARADAGLMEQKRQQLEQVEANRPKMGWTDSQGQPQKPGFLHSLGRALTNVAGATVPGQAIQASQYGPNYRRYEGQREELASQIEELQKQQQIEQAPIPSAAGMVYRPFSSVVGMERNQIAEQRAQTYAQQVLLRHQDEIARLKEAGRGHDIAQQRASAYDFWTRTIEPEMRDAILKTSANEAEARLGLQAMENNRDHLIQTLMVGPLQGPQVQPGQTQNVPRGTPPAKGVRHIVVK